ncbi:hypothetical protein [Methylobacterium symbioticum]|mgnify:CR=1 FL=1|uniref:Uncharacterized protein n=1 Tax=Methylobacterium symbioticum TaxID=2584084 RepID=A0A509EFT9_9HYPH|nr:hypothetical protein [Methylobacterium symbioticum]VUD73227.1 hypothetical protein MET9862_03842 [Methylobacterium symbioticum]
MKPAVCLAAGSFCFLAVGPVVAAGCVDDVTALDNHIKDMAKTAISTSTASKEAAGRREAMAEEAKKRGVPPAALPGGPEPGTSEATAVEQAAQAGGGGTGVMEAKAALNHARELANKGDDAGCVGALAEAKRALDKP